jgi:ribosome-binding ATPase
VTVSIGIVGLPNVGKSTLFNAITNSSVDAQNYPFCTIEPSSGIVPIPDARIQKLSELSGTNKRIYATIEFTDIAGLVKGASKGEGLGNQFLTNIRETEAIAHVVRCFDDPNIIHVNGKIDPLDDIDTIQTELLLSDLDMIERLIQNQTKRARTQDKDEKSKLDILVRIKEHLELSHPIRTLDLSEDEEALIKGYHFLTIKKTIYVANVAESDIGSENAYVKQVRDFAGKEKAEVVVICAHLEAELSSLEESDRAMYLDELGISHSGLDSLSQACFELLGLQTYLTTGEKETRAWTIKKGMTAPQAAGVIHTDFEKGFIRANMISYEDFLECGSLKNAKEKGVLRQEGKEYVMQDGDIVEFLFNV